jgi:type II secretory pathway predicted ATPase ExeA
VFLIDEAHLLHQDTLDHLHILLNYARDSRALLSLILVGLPELRERLALRHNRSLHSRLHHRLEVRDAVACFATQGHAQQRQARLLQRYALDEVKYAELSTELACSENALRVRVHKAMLALRKHIRECHSELEDLLGHDRQGC